MMMRLAAIGGTAAIPPIFRVSTQHSHSSRSAPQLAGRLSQVILVNQIAPGWRLRQPLSVWIDQTDDGDYLVSDEIFNVYGEGATWVEAQEDYIRSLIEYFVLMADYDDEPSRQLQASLRHYLQPF